MIVTTIPDTNWCDGIWESGDRRGARHLKLLIFTQCNRQSAMEMSGMWCRRCDEVMACRRCDEVMGCSRCIEVIGCRRCDEVMGYRTCIEVMG